MDGDLNDLWIVVCGELSGDWLSVDTTCHNSWWITRSPPTNNSTQSANMWSQITRNDHTSCNLLQSGQQSDHVFSSTLVVERCLNYWTWKLSWKIITTIKKGVIIFNNEMFWDQLYCRLLEMLWHRVAVEIILNLQLTAWNLSTFSAGS